MNEPRKVVAECWTCSYTAPRVSDLGATNVEVPFALASPDYGARTFDTAAYHKMRGHDVRTIGREGEGRWTDS